jgi:hypothetical protein
MTSENPPTPGTPTSGTPPVQRTPPTAQVAPTGGISPTPPNPDYPVRLDVDYPPRLSRLLIFVKGLLLIPHFIALFFLGIAGFVVIIISWFAVLITGRYPEGLFNFMVGLARWGLRVTSYYLLQTDRYPPFSLADDPGYPVRLEVDYPAHIARWRPLVHWLLVYPASIAAGAIVFVAYLAVIVAWFAILFTGRYPQGLFNLVTIALRWSARAGIYQYFMVEPYPPFVWA